MDTLLKIAFIAILILSPFNSNGQTVGFREDVLHIINEKERAGFYVTNYGIKAEVENLRWVYSKQEYVISEDCTFIAEIPLRIDPEEYHLIKNIFGNSGFRSVPDTFGELKPSYPMVLGYYTSEQLVDDMGNYSCDPCLSIAGGMVEICLFLVIKKDNIYFSLNRQQAQHFFPPIESPEEALSYLCMMENVYPIYDFSFLSYPYLEDGFTYEVFKKNLNKTFVKEDKDGYNINVFDTSRHYYCIEAIYKVYFDGTIEIIDADKLYSIPIDSAID